MYHELVVAKPFMLISASIVNECTVAELACNLAIDSPYSDTMIIVFIG